MFSVVNENRPLKLNGAKRKKLRRSMSQYGFLPAFPIMCRRKGAKLIIKDGQHRFAVAQELGLAVYYVVDDTDIDVAFLNDCQTNWNVSDYAGSFAARGNPHYIELLEFAEQHQLPLTQCIGILGNNAHERNLLYAFKNGEFKIKSREMADRIARLYSGISELNPRIRTRFFVGALFAACLVKDLDDERLVHGASRVPEDLIRYGSRDGYLDMLEKVYNYGRRVKFPLRIEAENALRARNPVQTTEAAGESEAA